jgi:hypothetical protein
MSNTGTPPIDYFPEDEPQTGTVVFGEPDEHLEAFAGPPVTEVGLLLRMAQALGLVTVTGLGITAAVVTTVLNVGVSKAGDGLPIAGDDAQPKPDPGVGGAPVPKASGDEEALPELQPDPGAAGAHKGGDDGDGGVRPPPSRATEHLPCVNTRLEEQVARVRAARDNVGDPSLRESLRNEEIERLRARIDDLLQKIPNAAEPVRGVLGGRLAAAQDRLRELLFKPNN